METLKLWIARNKDGILYLHYSKPERDEREEIYIAGLCSPIPYKMFPEVTWDNSPQEVELKLVKDVRTDCNRNDRY